ncbi:hypothetical protein [Citrobacter portucalensis]|uniref:hypothetical protein n=1 Tax=Citrobacter portucalensis TaxID=1639133 RepID=UPI0039F58759
MTISSKSSRWLKELMKDEPSNATEIITTQAPTSDTEIQVISDFDELFRSVPFIEFARSPLTKELIKLFFHASGGLASGSSLDSLENLAFMLWYVNQSSGFYNMSGGTCVPASYFIRMQLEGIHPLAMGGAISEFNIVPGFAPIVRRTHDILPPLNGNPYYSGQMLRVTLDPIKKGTDFFKYATKKMGFDWVREFYSRTAQYLMQKDITRRAELVKTEHPLMTFQDNFCRQHPKYRIFRNGLSVLFLLFKEYSGPLEAAALIINYSILTGDPDGLLNLLVHLGAFSRHFCRYHVNPHKVRVLRRAVFTELNRNVARCFGYDLLRNYKAFEKRFYRSCFSCEPRPLVWYNPAD